MKNLAEIVREIKAAPVVKTLEQILAEDLAAPVKTREQLLADALADVGSQSAPPSDDFTDLDFTDSPTAAQLQDLAERLRRSDKLVPVGEALARMLNGEPFLDMGQKGRNALATRVAFAIVDAFPNLMPEGVIELCAPGIQAAHDAGSAMTLQKFGRQLESAQDKLRATRNLQEAFARAAWDALSLTAAAPVAANDQQDRLDWPLLEVGSIFEALPPTHYLIEALDLAGGAPSLFAGYGFSGKSISIQSAKLSVAAGRPVWGKFPCSRERVLHIDFEQGQALTRRRYQRLARGMGVDPRELAGWLSLVSFPRLYVTLQNEDALCRRVEKFGWVTVDSLLAASPGLEENDSSARQVLDMWTRISERTGVAVSVIHHARKPSQNAGGAKMALRGSSAIFDAASSVLMFEAEEGEPTRVTHTKARHSGRPCKPFVLTILDVPQPAPSLPLPPGLDPHWGLVVTADGAEAHAEQRALRAAQVARQKIMAALSEAKVEITSKNALRALSCLGTDSFEKAFATLVSDGSVVQYGRGGRITLSAAPEVGVRPVANPDFSGFSGPINSGKL